MKSFLIAVAALAVISVLGLDYAAGVDSFTARPDGDGITLEWHSQIESGITSYTVQRSDVQTPDDFQNAGNVAATGSNSYYKFHDSPVSAAPLAGQNNNFHTLSDAFRYRLQINLSSGDISYSQTVNVTKPSSGVRRTWGMIKEMFH
ncbi:MAG TPA: hypothetical protein VFH95_11660 [Candidatus Kapabacteria bacterium]|nr:hypothetical protein [Candidatus Kapabacteria bacterium]